jgi:hypothetical protein
MLRLRFHASWLPVDHNQFWTIIDCSKNIETINDVIEHFNEQQKSLADCYQFHLSKRSTKQKYLKAFVNNCVLPPFAQANHILRDNDEIEYEVLLISMTQKKFSFSFRLEIDAENEWLLVKSPPTAKRKRSIVDEIPPSTNDLDSILRTMAQPITTTTTTKSPEEQSFSFQFGNKRGRPIPPRPQVISSVKVK